MTSLFKPLYAALFCVAVLVACGKPTDGPKVETAKLENGLEIIVIPDFRADVVTHMLWYRVGSEIGNDDNVETIAQLRGFNFRPFSRWPASDQ